MNLDRFATDQILPNVRKELEEYGDIRNGCLCLTGFSPAGRPSFAAVDNVSRPSDFERVSKIARFHHASKVLQVSDAWMTHPSGDAPPQGTPRPSASLNRQEAILIDLILPDGSVEWRIFQAYRRSGKRFTWDEPKKMDGGFQSFLPAWGSLGETK